MANSQTGQVVSPPGILRLVAYPGDNMVLLAMSLPDTEINQAGKNLAGFAIYRKLGNKAEQPLLNRLAFDIAITKSTTPEERVWTPTPEAPIQKFRWVDVPQDGFDGPITIGWWRAISRGKARR